MRNADVVDEDAHGEPLTSEKSSMKASFLLVASSRVRRCRNSSRGRRCCSACPFAARFFSRRELACPAAMEHDPTRRRRKRVRGGGLDPTTTEVDPPIAAVSVGVSYVVTRFATVLESLWVYYTITDIDFLGSIPRYRFPRGRRSVRTYTFFTTGIP
jgi:hypothetical protein